MKISGRIKKQFSALSSGKRGNIDSISMDYELISDKQKAIEYMLDSDWENTTLEAANQLAEFLSKNNPEFFKSWNEFALNAKEFLNDRVLSEIVKNISANNIDEDIKHCIEWDLLHSMLYFQYKELVGGEIPSFFGEIHNVYKAGYYPCGWDGQYPEGKLLIAEIECYD